MDKIMDMTKPLNRRNQALRQAELVEGFMSSEELEWLYDHAYGRSVEMGSYRGRSATVLGLKLQEVNGHLSCIDIFDEVGYQIFQENLKKSNLSPQVYRMKSVEAVNYFENESLDFVFIDSSHEYDDTLDEIVEWLPKLKRDGILCGHDYGHPSFLGLTQAVNELCPGFERPVGLIWCINVSQFSDLQRKLLDILKQNRRSLRKSLNVHHQEVIQLQGAINYYVEKLAKHQASESKYQALVAESGRKYQALVEKSERRYQALVKKKGLLQKKLKYQRQRIKEEILEATALRQKIEGMETSKFWKLRSFWFRLKQKL